MTTPRPRSRSRARRLGAASAALIALLAGLTACSSGDGGSPKPDASAKPVGATQSPAPTPEPGPATGACYQLPFDAAVAPTSDVAAVPCKQPHTSVTFAVGTVDAVVDGHLVAVDSQRVQNQVAAACPARLLSYVGGTRTDIRLSMIRSIWFTPTVEQSDAGAAWFRCDAVLLDGSSKLASLTSSLKGALAGPTVPDTYAMCGTAAPDAKNFERVRCSQRHSWRAIGVIAFDQARYPGESKVRAAGRTRCEDEAAKVAKDPLAFKWGYEWPTAEQWGMGQKFGRCWTTD
jgi:hypothetical protein